MTGAPGFPAAAVRGRAAGAGDRPQRRPHAAAPSSTSAARSATAASEGLLSIAFPPDYRQSKRFYVYYTDTAGNIRVDEFKRRSATRAAAGSRRRGDRDPPPGQLEPQRRPAAVPRRPPLPRDRRRRRRRRSAEQRPEPGGAARQAAADRPAAGRRTAVLGARRRTRSSATPGPRRDLQLRPAQSVPLLLRHGDRGGSRGSRSATSARTVSRRSTTSRPAAPPGANFGWDALRGLRRPTATKAAARPIRAARSSRSSPSRTAAAAAARSSAATSSATAACRSLYKRYVYADFCEGELRSLVPHLRRASDDRRLGLSIPSPSSFGEDTRGRLYVASLEGPVYRLVNR